MTDDPAGPVADGGAPVLVVEGFAGPLDALLELARAERIDLARLPIGALIDAFAAALEAALRAVPGQRVALGRLGDWLVMAATLAWLRSRLLLPADAPAAAAAARQAEALRRVLIARAQMAAAAEWLERRPRLGRDLFPRGGGAAAAAAGGIGDIALLLRACLAALTVPEVTATALRLRPPLWTVAEALARLRRLLGAGSGETVLTGCLPPLGDADPLRRRAALASTLLAALELARGGELTLDQAAAWMPVHLRRIAAAGEKVSV